VFAVKTLPVVISILYALVFSPLIRAYFWDNPAINVIPFMLLVMLTAHVYLKSTSVTIPISKDTMLLCLLFLNMAIYLIVYYDGIATFTNAFYFFTPAFFFVAVMVLFDRNSINQQLMKFFRVVFIVESACIILEVVDGLLGFDIHISRLFAWHMEVDTRFDQHIFVSNQGVPELELLPIALGIHGFPHYTAPIYVVSFIFTLAHSFSKVDKNQRMALSSLWSAAIVQFVGLFCIYMLGVKTHFVTAILAILILGVFLSRKILLLFVAFLGVAVPATLLIPTTRLRFENYLFQVLEGNAIEGSRIDVIFNFQEYLALLDLEMADVLLGMGSFDQLDRFAGILFLEQKFLVYMLVFGIPYMLVITAFFVTGLADSVQVFRYTKSSSTRATAIAAACSLMVYGLEMGHFGFTFTTPNFALVFVIIGIVAVLARDIKRNSAMFSHV
jgi:hypothetical protein